MYFQLLLVFPIRNDVIFTFAVYSCFLTNFQNGMNIWGLPTLYALQTCSIWLLMGITIERYVAVCHPIRAKIYNSPKKATVMVILICGAAFLYNFIRYFEERATFGDYVICGKKRKQLCIGGVIPSATLRDNELYTFWYGKINIFPLENGLGF